MIEFIFFIAFFVSGYFAGYGDASYECILALEQQQRACLKQLSVEKCNKFSTIPSDLRDRCIRGLDNE